MNTVYFDSFSGQFVDQRFAAAAAYLSENPGTRLVIPPGEYVITKQRAKRLQREVMLGKFGGNPEPKMFSPRASYETAFNLVGAEDIEIEGYGATVLLDGFMEGFNIERCRNVTIRGLRFDLTRKAYSKGIIIDGGEGYTDADFGRLTLVNEKMPSDRIVVVDKKSSLIMEVTGTERKEALGSGKIRFYGFSYGDYRGSEIYVWHTYHYRPSIHIYRSKNTVIEDVSIYNHCGMGVVGFQSEDIFMHRLNVVPSCAESVSTNTDATHFSSCRGKISFVSCIFEGHGDDAANIHGYYYDIVREENGFYKLSVNENVMTHSCKLDYPEVNDILQLSKKREIIPIGYFRVTEVIPDKEDWSCHVKIDEQLPEDLDEYFLANESTTPSLVFRDCNVKNHLARGILVKTHNVLIENCVFDHDTGTAIHVGAEAHWREGIVSNNIVIKNNRIIKSGYQGWGRILDAGGISINILSDAPHSPAHRNFLIENNTIDSSMTKHAIYAGNVDGLVIRNNTLTSAEECIVTEKCVNVTIMENKEI